MAIDPTNPSQSIGPDGSFRVALDQNTAPATYVIREHARKQLREARTTAEQAQAVADAFEAAFTAIMWLEYQQSLGERPSIDD